MQEHQDNSQVNNDEIEIDLVELFAELKKNWKLIAGTTVAFAVAAAIYSFCIAKPVYQYNAMIRIPANIYDQEYAVNTCIEILRADGVASISSPRKTSLISLSFKAETPSEARSLAKEYVPRAFDTVNKIIRGSELIVLENNIDKPIYPRRSRSVIIVGSIGFCLSSFILIAKYFAKR